MNTELSIDTICENFTSLTGEQLTDSAALFCTSAAEAVSSWLRPDVSVSDNQRLLCTAAASIAFYKYCTLKATSECEGFKAGDITLDNKPLQSVSLAKQLMDDAVSDITFLLKSKHFCFKRI